MPDTTIYGTNGNDNLSGGNGKDTIYGLDGDDIIHGGNGVDRLFGDGGNDQLFGDNGADDLTGGAGDDLLDGLNGFDIAYYSGPIGEYSFFAAAGYLHVVHLGGAGADGHDRLIRVERLVFADRVIDIGSGNNAPVAGDDHVSITEDTGTYSSGAASVKDNDFDFDGDALSVTGGTFVGTYGTLTLNANGTYSYALNASAQALAQGQTVTDSFNYTVSDNDGSDTGALVFHIAGVNDAPIAHADTASTSENATILVNVLTNDTDIDNGAVLTVTTASAPSGQGLASVVSNQVQFNPGTDFDDLAVGQSEVVVVSYSIQDQFGATSASTLTITVTGTNDGPVANPDTSSTSENATILVNVLTNDTDVDNGAVLTVTTASAPSGQGTASVVSNQVQFNPGTDFDDLAVGQSEVVVVSYSIQDQFGASSSSTLTITVTGTNDGPVANPDTSSTSENATILVNVLTNDTDIDNGAVLTVTTASAPSGQGSASVVGNQVQFNPGTDFDDLAVGQSEVVVVSYSIQDQFGATSASTLTITVTGTNDGPVANPDTSSTSENATILVNVLTNDTDIDNGAVLTVTTASAPSGQGSASVVSNQVQFNPGTDFDDLAVGQSEVVVVSYSIQDQFGASSSSTLTITVTGTNDGPVANPDTDTTSENVTLLVDVLANDTDVDNGAVLTVTAASAPSGEGSAAVVGNQVEFNPGTDFDYLAVGESTDVVVSYSIEDEHGAPSSSSLTITVTGTNDAPTIDVGGTDATGSATELPNNDPNENAFNHTDSGAVAFADVDLSDTHSASFTPQGGGYLGTFTLDPVDQMGDTVGWDFSVADSDLDFLADGETQTQTYAVQIDDGHGGTVTQDVTITLTGAADGPQTEWYIDNSAVGSTNVGTQDNPFISIASFNAAQGTVGGPQVGATVYLLAGTGTYTEADGFNLLDDQILIGVADGPVRPTIVTTGGGSDGIEVAQNNTISGLDIGNTNDVGIADSNGSVGTLTISDVGKSGTGQIVDIDQGGILNVTLNSATSLGSNDGAIDLNNVGGTFTVTGATTITGIHSDGGIDITGSSLTATFTGGGTVSTNNAVGVNFVGNTGSLVLGGGFDIVTTTGKALNATGGGTVTATGAGNSITSLTGTALTVSGTTIGAADLTFESISANGAVNGILLNNTGALGGLTVTGTGAAGSGGTIQSTTGSGIVATATGELNLGWINVLNTAGHGILATNLHGDNSLTDSVVSGFGAGSGNTMDGLRVVNNNTDLDLLAVTNTTFTNGTTGNDAIFVDAQGTSDIGLSVDNSSFTGLFGDGIQVNGNTGGTGDLDITIADSDFLNAVVNGNGGVVLNSFGGVTMRALVDGNTFDTIMRPNVNLGAITASNGGTANAHFTFQDNDIEDLAGGRGITFSADAGSSYLLIDNNDIDRLGTNSKLAISVSLTNTAVGDVSITDNAIGQAGNLWTAGTGTGNAVLLNVQNSAQMDALVDGNLISGNTSVELLRVRAINTAVLNATITDNTLADTAGGHVEFDATDGLAAGSSVINLDIQDNTLPGGVGVIRFADLAGGVLNVHQLSAADVAFENGGAIVTSSGTVFYNQPAPPLPITPDLPIM